MMNSFTLKRFFLVFLSVLFINTAYSQIIYGLQKSVAGSTTLPFDMVSIDPYTATTTTLFSTNSLTAVAVGATAFDQLNGRYICWGFDNTNTQKLFIANVDSSTVTTQNLLNAAPIEMEYDLQTQKNYGLIWDQAQSMEKFVEVDLTNGSLTTIGNLPGVSAVAIGFSSFDSNAGRFIFVGIENNQSRLISVDAATGNVLTSVPFNQNPENVVGMEYNVNNNKLYGLFSDIDSTNFSQVHFSYYRDLLFSEIDIATGVVTVINQTPVISGYFAGFALGGLAFDQDTETYIIQTAGDTSFQLQMIDAVTGNVFSNVSLTGSNPFYEIQVDNFDFADKLYGISSTESTPNFTATGKIYPNPTTDWLQLEMNKKIENVLIYNLLGQVVYQNANIQTTRIDVSDLDNGTYTVVVATENGLFREQFLKVE